MPISRLTGSILAIAGGAVSAGLIGGFALGAFVTGGPARYAADTRLFSELVGNPDAAYGSSGMTHTDPGSLVGPPMADIVCKGCGPGIAERMSSVYAFGYDDPTIDYRPMPAYTTARLEAEVARDRPESLLPTAANQPSLRPLPVDEPTDSTISGQGTSRDAEGRGWPSVTDRATFAG